MSEDSRQLVFRSYTISIMGLIFFVVGLGVLYLIPYDTQVACSHQAGDCTITDRRFIGPESSRSVALAGIEGAQVTKSRSDDGTMYRAVLNTRDGRVKLVGYRSSSRSEHEGMVDAVNRFLDDPDHPPLHVNAGGFVQYLLFVFPLTGFVLLFGVRNVTQVEVRPEFSDLQILKRRWWQRSGKEERIPLADIEKVDLVFRRSNRGSQTSKAVLRLKSGDVVSLFGFSSSGSGPYKRAEKLRKLLQPHVDHDL